MYIYIYVYTYVYSIYPYKCISVYICRYVYSDIHAYILIYMHTWLGFSSKRANRPKPFTSGHSRGKLSGRRYNHKKG